MNKILVVEDDQQLLNILTEYLVSLGFEVFTAGDGNSAYKLYVSEKPEIVISDIRMPKQDGLGFLLKAKGSKDHQARGMILTSGYMNTQNSNYPEILKMLGATEFLQKPFTLSTLKEKIDNILAE